MKLRRILAVFLALGIAAGVYVFFSTRQDNSRGAVTLWYEKGGPLADEIEKLAEDYNSDMARSALPVETKCFENEQELSEAYETGSPDILVCSHLRAFSLAQREKLADISAEATFVPPDYPQNVLSRNSSISSSFFPLGMSVPVAVINNSLVSQRSFSSLEDFFSEASFYTQKTGKPFFTCDSISELFCLYMLRHGEEFDGDFEKMQSADRFLTLYNALAEATFEGSISYVGEDGINYLVNNAVPCVLTTSDRLKGVASDRITVCDVPAPDGCDDSDTVGTAWGFAVTNGGCRSKADTAAFLSWVFSGDRSARAALNSRLAPAEENSRFSGESVETLLTGIAKNALVTLPGPESGYIANKERFEESFLKEMERLMP